MLKYIKRRCVDEEEDSENESKLSEPSMSKAEKEVSVKKIRLYDSYLAMVLNDWLSRRFCYAFQRKSHYVITTHCLLH
jgi:hypothetical protein